MIIRTNFKNRRGAAMVESSFGLVILLFVIFGIMEYAQLVMARQLMAHAAWTAGRWAAVGTQPATYPDGTATPAPNGAVTTAFLNTWITKSMAPAPVSNVTAQFYGSNADGTPNTSVPWSSVTFSQGIYVNLQATYIPLFSGNRLYNSTGNTGPMVGSVGLTTVVYVRAEANNY